MTKLTRLTLSREIIASHQERAFYKAEGELADVICTDVWKAERFSRASKLEWLTDGAVAGAIEGGVPVVREAFAIAGSGIQTKRNSFVYDVKKPNLTARVADFPRSQEPVSLDQLV